METNKEKAHKEANKETFNVEYKDTDYDVIQTTSVHDLIDLAATPDELPTLDEQLQIIQEVCHPFPNISVTELNAAGFYIMSSKPPVPKIVAPKITLTPNQIRVLELLKTSLNLKIEDIASNLKINLMITWDALDTLICMGLIEPTGRGTFDVTEKGKTYKNE